MAQILVYDGGCPFCRHFALRSELVGGLPDLEIRDLSASRHQHGVDNVDNPVRLHHIGDGNHRAATLGIGQGQRGI